MLDNPNAPAPSQIPTAPRTSGSSGAGRLLTTLAAIIAVGGLAFAAGRLTAPGTTATGAGGAGPGAVVGGAAGFGPSGSFAPGAPSGSATLSGTVESVAGSMLTLQASSGATVTVELSGSTTYHGQTAATASDVSAGKEVLVQLSTGAASSSTAPASSGTQPAFTAGDVTIVTRSGEAAP